MNKIIIDGTDAVLGRLSAFSAKQALLGKEVIIVNCPKVIITGARRMIIGSYKETVERGGHSLNGPFWIKRDASRLVKRTIRGMLSHREGRGRLAFKRIMCYNDVPKEYESAKKISMVSKNLSKKFALSELVKEL